VGSFQLPGDGHGRRGVHRSPTGRDGVAGVRRGRGGGEVEDSAFEAFEAVG